MNIVQIHSGLGNQMFQYAFYVALKHNQSNTKIDASIYRHRPSHNGYELERIFAVEPVHAIIDERNRMADVGKDWFSVFRHTIGWKRKTHGQLVIEPNPSHGWCPDLLHCDNCYLQGYWQTEKYFAKVANQVRMDFTFRQPLNAIDMALANKLTKEKSVSVHIRRGDYIKERRRADYEVCTAEYYRRAVAYIQAHVDSPVFYVFSDDPTWGQEQNIFPKDTIFVSGHEGADAYIDMQLMSLCCHHVIANSSFSWWGAWLGQHENTITLAPSTWFRYRERPDIIPDNWIKIDAE